MQLSPHEAIVMISGVHPVRARKVRYYEDPQFQNRILKPSRAVRIGEIARSDEWSGHAPIIPSAKLLAARKNKVHEQDGGLCREPELPQQEEVVLTSPSAEREFDAAPDEGEAVQAAALNRSMQGLARAVSLDPDDKMGL
jgi:type IV secretion system protein VirD4